MSMKTAKQMTKAIKGNIQVKKNIDQIIHSYDSVTSYVERRKNIREKMDNDIKVIK